jgi:hypothetical protein
MILFFESSNFERKNIVYPVAFGILYMITNCVATFVRGKPIYYILDWVSVRGYIYALATIVVTLGAHFLGCAISAFVTD